jgi:hypothetical protein
MALLLIILALFGFVFWGVGSSSPSMQDYAPATKPFVKCSKQMSAEQQKQRHCYPPANP